MVASTYFGTDALAQFLQQEKVDNGVLDTTVGLIGGWVFLSSIGDEAAKILQAQVQKELTSKFIKKLLTLDTAKQNEHEEEVRSTLLLYKILSTVLSNHFHFFSISKPRQFLQLLKHRQKTLKT